MVFLFVGYTNGREFCKIGRMVETMSKVLPLSKNHKDYEDVPDGLKWAIPIHECLEKPEVKARSKRLEEQSKKRVDREFGKKKILLTKSL